MPRAADETTSGPPAFLLAPLSAAFALDVAPACSGVGPDWPLAAPLASLLGFAPASGRDPELEPGDGFHQALAADPPE